MMAKQKANSKFTATAHVRGIPLMVMVVSGRPLMVLMPFLCQPTHRASLEMHLSAHSQGLAVRCL